MATHRSKSIVVDRNHIVLYVLSLSPGPVNEFRTGTTSEIQTRPNYVSSIGRFGQHLLNANQPSGCIKPGPPTHAERKIMEEHRIVCERICEPLRASAKCYRHSSTVDVCLRSEQADEALILPTYQLQGEPNSCEGGKREWRGI